MRKDVGDVFMMNFEWALTTWVGEGSPVCIFSKQPVSCAMQAIDAPLMITRDARPAGKGTAQRP